MAEITQAEHETALAAARTESATVALATGVEQGRAEERTRISAILESEEAATRPAAARMLAFDTDKDAASASVALAKLPAEGATTEAPATAGAPAGMFTAAMNGSANPDLGEAAASELTDDDLMIEQSFSGRRKTA